MGGIASRSSIDKLFIASLSGRRTFARSSSAAPVPRDFLAPCRRDVSASARGPASAHAIFVSKLPTNDVTRRRSRKFPISSSSCANFPKSRPNFTFYRDFFNFFASPTSLVSGSLTFIPLYFLAIELRAFYFRRFSFYAGFLRVFLLFLLHYNHTRFVLGLPGIFSIRVPSRLQTRNTSARSGSFICRKRRARISFNPRDGERVNGGRHINMSRFQGIADIAGAHGCSFFRYAAPFLRQAL